MRQELYRWKKLLCYGGLERAQYRAIAAELDEANRKSIVTLSIACLLVYALRLCLRYSAVPMGNRVVFLGAIVLFGLLAAVNHRVRHCHWVVHASADLFLTFYLAVGILAAVGAGSIQERTTLYLVFITVAPMLFALSGLELAAIVLPAEGIYLALIRLFQSGYPVYAANRGNSLFFSLTGLLLGIYMGNMKISGVYNTYISARMEEVRALNRELAASREGLRDALDQAERANRAKTVFLNSMSHDIRTPMNAILGFTALAQRYIDDPARVADCLEKTTTAGQHLLSLINDVLDLSRIESGRVALAQAPVDLSALTADVSSILQANLTDKHLSFTISDTTEHLTVLGDRLRLRQILLNLLGNAVKFTPPGGQVRLTVDGSPASDGTADLTFRVQDNGIGMSPEFQEHIFQAFSREESSVQAIQGSGLGMAITKNLVDQMGGTIVVRSREGAGTEFTVTLRLPITQQAEDRPDSAVPPDFSGKHILLVEDNPLNEEIARTILSDAGFSVTSVHDGAAAVDQVACSAPGTFDLVLMDVQMPGMDGYEATRRIRALTDPARAGLPILAATANAFEEDRQAALAAGMNGHITKPIEIFKLLAAMARLLP